MKLGGRSRAKQAGELSDEHKSLTLIVDLVESGEVRAIAKRRWLGAFDQEALMLVVQSLDEHEDKGNEVDWGKVKENVLKQFAIRDRRDPNPATLEQARVTAWEADAIQETLEQSGMDETPAREIANAAASSILLAIDPDRPGFEIESLIDTYWSGLREACSTAGLPAWVASSSQEPSALRQAALKRLDADRELVEEFIKKEEGAGLDFASPADRATDYFTRARDDISGKVTTANTLLTQWKTADTTLGSSRSAFLRSPEADQHAAGIATAVTAYLNAAHPTGHAQAVASIKEYTERVVSVPIYRDQEHKLTTDVIDEALATLEYERAAALTRRGGEPQAERISAAIEALRARRSTEVFLRPSSAYLRNSYPVTAFQQLPPLTRNSILLSDGDHLEKKDVINAVDIDRQFWQNINHLYLKGGGSTNYAVMRDDVGNFVVKQYSSDPKKIYESASNLATYAMSTAQGAAAGTLLNRPGESGAREAGPIGKQLLALRERRATRERDDYIAVASIIRNGLRVFRDGDGLASLDESSEAFRGIVENPTLTAVLERADSIGDKPVSQTDHTAPYKPDVEARNAFNAAAEFHDQLRRLVIVQRDATNLQSVHNDLSKIRTVLSDPILQQASKRRNALAEFLRVLQIIGEASDVEQQE